MSEIRPKFIRYLIIDFLIAALTSATISAYLIPQLYQLGTGGLGGIILRPQKTDFTVLYQGLSPVTVRIFARKDSTTAPAIYADQDMLALGAILTSDGWIITTGLSQSNQSLVIVDNTNNIYPVDQFLVDSATGLVFIKIKAQDLPVASLASDPAIGDQVVLLNPEPSQSQIVALDAVKAGKNSFIYSTEAYPYYIELADPAQLGAPIFNSSHELMGLAFNDSGRTLVKSSKDFSQRITDIINKSPRPSLGINYIDLGRWPVQMNSGIKSTAGELVVDPKDFGVAGVAKNSLADKAGIKAGDVIVQVNGQDLTVKQNLTEYIQGLKPDQEVDLLIRNEAGEKHVKVTLGKI